MLQKQKEMQEEIERQRQEAKDIKARQRRAANRQVLEAAGRGGGSAASVRSGSRGSSARRSYNDRRGNSPPVPSLRGTFTTFHVS